MLKDDDATVDRYLAAPGAADYMKVSLSWLRKKLGDGQQFKLEYDRAEAVLLSLAG